MEGSEHANLLQQFLALQDYLEPFMGFAGKRYLQMHPRHELPYGWDQSTRFSEGKEYATDLVKAQDAMEIGDIDGFERIGRSLIGRVEAHMASTRGKLLEHGWKVEVGDGGSHQTGEGYGVSEAVGHESPVTHGLGHSYPLKALSFGMPHDMEF